MVSSKTSQGLLRQHNIPTLLLKEVTVEKKNEHNIPVYEEGGRDTAFEMPMEEKGWREALEEISEKNDCYSRVEAIKTSFSRVFHTDVCLVYDVRTLLG